MDLLQSAPDSSSGGADIIDVTIETFERDVLQASMERPVIADFWATWCGPCKTLTPMLEKAVAGAGGAVSLAKIDIDKNQMLASQLRIQSVPTVFAFFQGRPVDGFQGAVPESEIKAFVDRLVAMKGGAPAGGGPDMDAILTAAEEALAGGDPARAAEAFAAVAQTVGGEDEPKYLRALAGLAQCHLTLGDAVQAQQIIDTVPEDKRGDAMFASVIAALSLAKPGIDAGAIGQLRTAAEQNPNDPAASFAYAEGLVGAGEMEAGVEQLLSLIAADRDWNEGAARAKLLDVFEALGPTNPLTLKARRRLSSILFA